MPSLFPVTVNSFKFCWEHYKADASCLWPNKRMFLSRHRLDSFEFIPCFCLWNFFSIVTHKRTWTDLHRLCLVFWTKSPEENRTAWSSYCTEPHQTLSVLTFNQPSDVAWSGGEHSMWLAWRLPYKLWKNIEHQQTVP